MRGALLLTTLLLVALLPLPATAAAAPAAPKVVVGPLLTPPNPAVYASFPFILQPTAQPQAVSPAGPTEEVAVIMMDFPDRSPSPSHTTTYYNDLLFDASPGAASVRQFYRENSYNQTALGGRVADGWYRSAETMVYYGADGSGIDDANGPIYCLTVEAAVAADGDLDYRDFDLDGDGVVDHLVIVHAGGAQENSADPNLIWSHRWAIIDARNCGWGSRRLVLDGVEIYGYYMAAEGSPMGVFAHELGHDFGLPDLYDTTGNTLGIGVWGIMGTGSWNGNPAGSAPAHFTPWTKAQLGWLTLTEVTTPLLPATVRQVEVVPEAYKLPIKTSPRGDEYFIVENRQRVGFDVGLPGAGLLIWHVDETHDNNDLPTARLVDLEEADDGSGFLFADHPDQATDVWTDSDQGFHPNSTPDSNDNTGATTGWKVADIGPSGGAMTANISRGVALDLAVLSITKEDFVPVDAATPLEVTVLNKGLATATNASVAVNVYYETYEPDARVFSRLEGLATLLEGEMLTRGYTFTPDQPGRYLIEAFADLEGDEAPEDNLRLVHLQAGDLLFRDDVEGGGAGWSTISLYEYRWEVVENGDGYGPAHTPTRAWRFGYFGTGAPSPSPYHYLDSPVIPLNGAAPWLVFYQRYTLAGGFGGAGEESDTAIVEVRFDGGLWQEIARVTGNDASWRRAAFDLAPFGDNASTLQIRFNVTATVLPDEGGWWIDDIAVVSADLGPAPLVVPLVTQGEVLPGGTAIPPLKFLLVNLGDLYEEFHFQVEGLPSDWSAFIGANETGGVPVTDYQVSLDVDEQVALTLIVQAPLLAERGATLDGTLIALTVQDLANASFVFTVNVPLGFGFDLRGQTLVLVIIIAGVLLAIAVVLTAVKRRRGY